MPRPKNPEDPKHRSFRVNDRVWRQAQARAKAEGTSAAAATADLLEGYARGIYNLPVRKVVREFPTQDTAGNS